MYSRSLQSQKTPTKLSGASRRVLLRRTAPNRTARRRPPASDIIWDSRVGTVIYSQLCVTVDTATVTVFDERNVWGPKRLLSKENAVTRRLRPAVIRGNREFFRPPAPSRWQHWPVNPQPRNARPDSVDIRDFCSFLSSPTFSPATSRSRSRKHCIFETRYGT